MKLEPSGGTMRASGRMFYAIWHWTDADGVTMVPCAAVAALGAVNAGETCDDRGSVALSTRSADSLVRVMERAGLIDDERRVTEKGSVIGFFFRRRRGVREGFETAHSIGVPW